LLTEKKNAINPLDPFQMAKKQLPSLAMAVNSDNSVTKEQARAQELLDALCQMTIQANLRPQAASKVCRRRMESSTPWRSAEPSDNDEIKNAIRQSGRTTPVPDIEHFESWRAAHLKARSEEDAKMSTKQLLADWLYRKDDAQCT